MDLAVEDTLLFVCQKFALSVILGVNLVNYMMHLAYPKLNAIILTELDIYFYCQLWVGVPVHGTCIASNAQELYKDLHIAQKYPWLCLTKVATKLSN